MSSPTRGLRPRPPRSGFTLVELLTVLVIVSIIAAVALPVVIPAISHRQVSESARIIQGGLVAARDSALRTNTPHGIRFLPDSTYNGQDPTTSATANTAINPLRALASNRFIPIEQPPGYSEGKLFVDVLNIYTNGEFTAPFPLVGAGVPTGLLYPNTRVLMVGQAFFRPVPGAPTPTHAIENPTSWYWNVRVGDKLQINDIGPYYTVVGPVEVPNPERFVNLRDGAFTLVAPPTTVPAVYANQPYSPEILFLVNGVDDDKDGYVDNGWDGVNNADNPDGSANGLVDELLEWSEVEAWPAAFTSAGASVVGTPSEGVPYTIVRRPAPSPGSRETALPGNVVVDLTSSFETAERSRLPVDPMSGNVDILLDGSGRIVPTTIYSTPAAAGMASSFYHIWVAERSDVTDVSTVGLLGDPPAPQFFLPMTREAYDAYSPPLGADAGLVMNNPNLPTLKGEMRLLSISTRTGNMITTDRPVFDVTNVNRPYHAPQLGRQGDTP